MTAATTRRIPDQADPERSRRLGRADLYAPVEISKGNRRLSGVARNLSLGGMFVACPRCPSVGERVAIRLSIVEEADPIEIAGEVRWSREVSDGEERPAGMGIRFTEPMVEAAVFVRVLLRLYPRNGA